LGERPPLEEPVSTVFYSEEIAESIRTAIEVEILPVCDHPADSADVPSYQDATYRWLRPRLTEAAEAWAGDESWILDGEILDLTIARKHLPKSEAEDDDAYSTRLHLSPFPDFFKPVVQGFAGLLGDLVEGESIPAPIKALLSDVDMQGSSLALFMKSADEIAWRDGAIGIFVEHTDGLAQTPRPYLVPVERVDLISLKAGFVGARVAFTQVICREHHEIPLGAYGSETQTYYRIYTPGISTLVALVKVKDAIEVRQVEEPRLHTAKGVPLEYVPFVLYSLSSSGKDVTRAPIPFKPLFRLQDLWFQVASGYHSVIDKCNIPVPVRIGLVVPGQKNMENVPEMILGPGYGIDLAVGGDFKYAEPSGNAIGGSRTALQDIESRAVRYGLEFLTGQASSTATEADLRSVPARAKLAFAAIQKESAIQEILDFWSQYLAIKKPADTEAQGGFISVSRDMLKAAMDPTLVGTLSALVDRNQLSLSTFLQLLVNGRVLPRDTDVEAEELAIAEAGEAAMQRVLKTAELQATATSAYKTDVEAEVAVEDAGEDLEPSAT